MLKNQKAFTFVELIVTLVVFATLTALALPSFQHQIANNRSMTLTEDMIDALNYARTEALKRGAFVTFCPVNNTVPASVTGCGSNWLNGWMVVVDTAASATTKPPVVADILRRWESRDSNTSITMDSSSRTFIRYTNLGTLAPADNSSATITLQVKNCTANAQYVVTISASGMLTKKQNPCTN